MAKLNMYYDNATAWFIAENEKEAMKMVDEFYGEDILEIKDDISLSKMHPHDDFKYHTCFREIELSVQEWIDIKGKGFFATSEY